MSQDDSNDTQSRADRLIDRRGRSEEHTRSDSTENNTNSEEKNTQTGQPGQTEQPGTTGQTGQDGDSDSSGDTEWSQAGDENVKRENKALYMYLDQRLHDTVTDVFEDVKYHYRKIYDVELQKNRHVYPLILEYGIEPVREMADSPSEVHDALDANPHTPVPTEVSVDG